MTNEQQGGGYWLNREVAEITKRYPEGEIIVSSGISPSGNLHVGHFRELLTAHALTWGLKQAGRQARHVHVSDDFDPLRRRYDFLPESFEQYVGWPLALIPDPDGDCHQSYADHFFSQFEVSVKQMGVDWQVVSSYRDLYLAGKMAPYIEKALEQINQIHHIFEQVANRKLPKDWTPVQVMGEDNVLRNAAAAAWDSREQTIEGVDYVKSGRVKLNWRLDWPARWGILGVKVEPFSWQEHGAAGGSYDTGKEFAKQIFGIEPPYPAAQYANIHLPGDTKKMSSSLNNLVTPEEALKIMPPEILRYFVIRSKPERTLYFDSGLGLYNLIDEYSKLQEALEAGEHPEFEDAYRLASAISGQRVISSVPFNHLVSVYQAALGKVDQALDILERTGYQEAIKQQKEVLEREFDYVKNWLDKYAPDSVKFQVQKELPLVELSSEQKKFLKTLADSIEDANMPDGQKMHELIYTAKDEAGIKPSEAFQAIYRVILGKDSGPKAGWFLASLDNGWLVQRLRLEA